MDDALRIAPAFCVLALLAFGAAYYCETVEVEGHSVETYYHPLIKLLEGDGYLRVVIDGDFTDVETRIPYSFLEAVGWRKDSA